MAKIAFKCENCGHGLAVDSAHAGKKSKCPKCSSAIVIPAAAVRQAHDGRVLSPPKGAAAATPPVPAKRPDGCPGCGRPVSPEQVICVNCGFNLKTGERLKTSMPPLRGLSEGPPRKSYPVRFAGGKGGKGKRLSMGTPAEVILTPEEEDPEKRIEFEGRRSVPGGRGKVLVLALLATGAAFWIAHRFAQEYQLYMLPSFLVWYLVLARAFREKIATRLCAKGSARAVYDDKRSWLSVEVSPGEWVSFVTVKGMMPRPEETDEKAYEIVKGTLGDMLGDGLEARR